MSRSQAALPTIEALSPTISETQAQRIIMNIHQEPGKRGVTSDDIITLRRLLSSTAAAVLSPSDPGYEKTIERWSRAAEKPAGVTVVPSSTEDVAVVVKYANDNNIDLAVKGGGHSTAGASSTNGGLLIDLGGGLRYTNVDAKNKLLYVGGGALWGDVDEAAWKHGLATVGGTVADTGVGGLTLGGGYGALSGEHGLVIDNVVSATVVVANGEIKHVSETENPDLFWALLEAGQNFGVTTEFVLQAFPQSDMCIGTMLFAPTPENVSRLVAAVNDLHEVKHTPQGPKSKSQGRSMTLLSIAKPPAAGGQTLMVAVLAFNGPESEAREMYKEFLSIGAIAETITMAPYTQVNKQLPAPSGMRSSMKGAAFVLPLRDGFVHEVLATYEAFTASCDDANGSLVSWELYDPSIVVHSDKGSFANRGFHLNNLIMPMWTQPIHDQKCRQWARDVSNMFKKEMEVHNEMATKGLEGDMSLRGNKGAVLLYGNYDQYDEISKDIFGVNHEQLAKTKQKYDPGNMFNKLFAITPAA
ncbi:hypothetical protein LTR22_012351 [Elasticomyces elasticus]|nr:hypothetical protein LTR22_012351 [Elasticomyces elasticus]KAK4903925.1 hypothetical protein LTR49_026537 [Elasticomyces elasticus]KAK5738293.1 hypothetical protein LTS12_025639 [Elasticomyces elasticus]